MKLNKKYIAVIVISLVAIIYEFLIITSMKEELQSLQNNLNMMQSNLQVSIDNINNNISNTINEELGKSHLTKDVVFSYDKNTEDGYELDVRVELSKFKENSNVIFAYKENSSNIWNSINLEERSDLSFGGKIKIKSDKEYQYKVMLKGSLNESGDIEYLDKYSFLPYPPDINIGWSTDKEVYVNAYINTYEDGIDNIKDMNLIVKTKGKEKTFKMNKEKNEDISEDDTIIYYDYKGSIEKGYYIKGSSTAKVKVIYNNGYIDIIDITDTINSEIQY